MSGIATCGVGRLFIVFACLTTACSGGSSSIDTPVAPTPPVPASPVPQANLIIVSESTMTLASCEARIAEAIRADLPTTSCPLSGALHNTGQGCAANVRGETTINRDNAGQQQVGAGQWSHPGVIGPGEQIIYAGESITVPTSGQWFWRSSVSWDNVRC